MIQIGALMLALLVSVPAFAGQITLKNGDHVTGTIVKSDTKTLVIKTDYAGEVTVKWPAVVSLESSQELYVGLSGGQIVAGSVTINDGKIQIQTKDAGTVTSSKDAVQFMRSNVEEAAYKAKMYRLEHPRLSDFWSGFLDAGLSTTRGNSNTLSFTFDGKAIRATAGDKFTVYFNSILTKSSVTGPTLTTAQIATPLPALGGSLPKLKCRRKSPRIPMLQQAANQSRER